MKTKLVALLLMPATFASPSTALACSVCGCSLSSDWAAQGYSMTPGLEAGVRFEYLNQTDLRSGTRSVDRPTITFPNEAEIQQRTLNRATWLDLNYVFNSSWALTASLPYSNRFHTTVAEGDKEISASHASGLGDLRLLGGYQTSGLAHRFSFQFGLKLPTGRFDQNFVAGPQAGELLDRGLQLGTGTTDLLASASWFARPATNLGIFTQAQLDQPLAARENFLPSTKLTLTGGARWLNTSRFTPQLQLNFKTESREHGTKGDNANSGGTFVHLSPGVTTEITARSSAFVFVQLPVYQHVNGLQLEPKCVISFGTRLKF